MKKKLNFNELNNLAKKLANFSEANTVIALIGDLGTGKTTFLRNLQKN